MRELDALPPPEWLVEGLIPEASLVVPFGPPKAGKTFIVLSWSLHVAAGLPWFGRAVKQAPSSISPAKAPAASRFDYAPCGRLTASASTPPCS